MPTRSSRSSDKEKTLTKLRVAQRERERKRLGQKNERFVVPCKSSCSLERQIAVFRGSCSMVGSRQTAVLTMILET